MTYYTIGQLGGPPFDHPRLTPGTGTVTGSVTYNGLPYYAPLHEGKVIWSDTVYPNSALGSWSTGGVKNTSSWKPGSQTVDANGFFYPINVFVDGNAYGGADGVSDSSRAPSLRGMQRATYWSDIMSETLPNTWISDDPLAVVFNTHRPDLRAMYGFSRAYSGAEYKGWEYGSSTAFGGTYGSVENDQIMKAYSGPGLGMQDGDIRYFSASSVVNNLGEDLPSATPDRWGAEMEDAAVLFTVQMSQEFSHTMTRPPEKYGPQGQRVEYYVPCYRLHPRYFGDSTTWTNVVAVEFDTSVSGEFETEVDDGGLVDGYNPDATAVVRIGIRDSLGGLAATWAADAPERVGLSIDMAGGETYTYQLPLTLSMCLQRTGSLTVTSLLQQIDDSTHFLQPAWYIGEWSRGGAVTWKSNTSPEWTYRMRVPALQLGWLKITTETLRPRGTAVLGERSSESDYRTPFTTRGGAR